MNYELLLDLYFSKDETNWELANSLINSSIKEDVCKYVDKIYGWCQYRMKSILENGKRNSPFDWLFYDDLVTSIRLDKSSKIPPTITGLYCEEASIEELPVLSDNIRTLHLPHNRLKQLPTLPTNLESLHLNFNLLTSLPELPDSLKFLTCKANYLTKLPKLSSNLKYLNCSFNSLTELPDLPSSLYYLIIRNNPLKKLPDLSNVEKLYMDKNQIHLLPKILPINLEIFY